MFINFGFFSRPYCLIRQQIKVISMVIYYIEHVYLRPYVYSFCQIFQALRLLAALRLFQTLEQLVLSYLIATIADKSSVFFSMYHDLIRSTSIICQLHGPLVLLISSSIMFPCILNSISTCPACIIGVLETRFWHICTRKWSFHAIKSRLIGNTPFVYHHQGRHERQDLGFAQVLLNRMHH